MSGSHESRIIVGLPRPNSAHEEDVIADVNVAPLVVVVVAATAAVVVVVVVVIVVSNLVSENILSASLFI